MRAQCNRQMAKNLSLRDEYCATVLLKCRANPEAAWAHKLSTEMDSVDYARTDWSNSNWAEL